MRASIRKTVLLAIGCFFAYGFSCTGNLAGPAESGEDRGRGGQAGTLLDNFDISFPGPFTATLNGFTEDYSFLYPGAPPSPVAPIHLEGQFVYRQLPSADGRLTAVVRIFMDFRPVNTACIYTITSPVAVWFREEGRGRLSTTLRPSNPGSFRAPKIMRFTGSAPTSAQGEPLPPRVTFYRVTNLRVGYRCG